MLRSGDKLASRVCVCEPRRISIQSRSQPASEVLELDSLMLPAGSRSQHPRLKEEEQYYKSDRGSSISSWCLTLVLARTLLCVWVCVLYMCAHSPEDLLGFACVRACAGHGAKRGRSPIISPHTARLNVRMIDISWGRAIITLEITVVTRNPFIMKVNHSIAVACFYCT